MRKRDTQASPSGRPDVIPETSDAERARAAPARQLPAVLDAKYASKERLAVALKQRRLKELAIKNGVYKLKPKP